MPNYSWDEAEDDDLEETSLVKQLRKQLKEQGRVIKERDTELGELKPRLRKSSVSDLLTEIKADPRLAGLVPAEVETTKEAISAWFDAHKDLFGTAPQQAQAEASEQPAVQNSTSLEPEAAAAWQRVQAQEASPGNVPNLGSEEAFLEQLKGLAKDAKGPQDLISRMQQAGPPTS